MENELLHTEISRRVFLKRATATAGLLAAGSLGGLLGAALKDAPKSAGPSGAYGVGPMGGLRFGGE